MPYDPITSVESIRSELEDVWKKIDEVYLTLQPGQWLKKFRKTWARGDASGRITTGSLIFSGELKKLTEK